MNSYMVLGLFAMYVASISLVQVLCGQQDALLAFLRRCWGRRIGHSLYFFSHVALPLLICVLALGWGIRHYEAPGAAAELTGQPQPPRIEFDAKRYGVPAFPPVRPFTADRNIYGA